MSKVETKGSLEEAESLNEVDTIKEFQLHMAAKREANMNYMKLIMRAGAAVVMLLGLFYIKTTSKNANLFSDGFCM
jgi:hypothetical protein